jgi:cold shock CspA family protein
MRTKGKITHWNEDKGYGFITPSTGAKQVFVHISAFSNPALRPRIDQIVTFTLSTDKRGRPCAEDIVRDGEPAAKLARRAPPSGASRKMAVLLVVVLIAVVGYSKYQKAQTSTPLPVRASAPAEKQQPKRSPYHCDGRTHCSEMSSCSEAKFFIQNCPNTKMDGDHDGVPCESQWCN